MEAEGSPHFSTPKKGEDPVLLQLAEHIKSLQTSQLKQILAAISKKWMPHMCLIEIPVSLVLQGLRPMWYHPYYIF